MIGTSIELYWHTIKKNKMKHSISNLAAVKHISVKLLFCGQVLILSLALPSLFYVGISYNEGKQKNHYKLTNKGKKTLVYDEKANRVNTARFSNGI